MDAELFDPGVMLKHLVPEGEDAVPGFPIAIIGQAADENIDELLAAFEKEKAEKTEEVVAGSKNTAKSCKGTGCTCRLHANCRPHT